MRLTIDFGAIVNDTSLTATRPPNLIVMWSACRTLECTSSSRDGSWSAGRAGRAGRSGRCLGHRDSSRAISSSTSASVMSAPSDSASVRGGFAQQLLRPLLRNQAAGAEQHHQHEHDAEEQELVLLELVGDVQAGPVVELDTELAQAGAVDPGQDDRADRHTPDVAHAAEHDHQQHRDRDREQESRRCDVAGDRRGEPDAAEAAEERTDRVGGQLRPDQRDAHHARRQLVLADGQPGATQPAVADAQRDEHADARRGRRARAACRCRRRR